ncbi:serine protease easter-like isoform X2 [Contarinia nasturtii]|uniref:serine protease easter-like isoform X2 n=1 Tax=Contarinia nasturtii TaxID=265458 RepID=UPI0012D3DB6A|nr:serine protease easter-like isoform X2 [Contarinia nasturtii]
MQLYIQLCIALMCLIGLGSTQEQCPTPGEKCKDLRHCPILDNLLRQAHLSAAERKFITDSQCGHFFGYPWVCCPLTIPTTTPAAVELPKPGVCGSQIANGRKDFGCGGVLINENYVLTASHCVNSKALVDRKWIISGVRLGEWDVKSQNDCEENLCSDPVQNVRVAERIPHENYNPNLVKSQNDIALLRLERPVNYTQWIKPICLPTNDDVADKNFAAVPLIVAGWGQTESGSKSDKKMKLKVNGTPLDYCNIKYHTLTSTQLCAGGQTGKDSCNGDSGGPLMVKHSTDSTHNHYYLVGLVSFGPTPCGQPGWPGVYTRVDHYMDWIKANIKP